jgi:hypothetical protein
MCTLVQGTARADIEGICPETRDFRTLLPAGHAELPSVPAIRYADPALSGAKRLLSLNGHQRILWPREVAFISRRTATTGFRMRHEVASK